MIEARPQSRLRRLIGHLRALLLTTIAVVIIFTAVVVGIGRALIPYADELRPWLSEQLSARLDQPVQIQRLEAEWPRLTPQLTLHGTSVGPDETPLLEVGLARLELHLPDLFRADRNPFRLVVLGLDLVLAEDAQGQWGLRLEGGGQLDERSEREAKMAGDLLVRDARLTVRPREFPEFATRLVEGEIRRRGAQTRVQGLLEPGAADGPGISFNLLLDHPGDRWSGARAWAVADELILSQWLAAPWLPEQATVSLEAWLNWSARTGGRLDMDLSLSDGGLGDEVIEAELLMARFERTSYFELVSLHAQDLSEQAWLSGLAVARSAESWALGIEKLDLEALFQRLRPWLPDEEVVPDTLGGHIRDLSAGWRPGMGFHALTGELRDLSVQLPFRQIEMAGLNLDLALAGDRIQIQPRGGIELVWPDLFRQRLTVDELGGKLFLNADGLELADVRVDNEFVSGRAEGWIYRRPERPFLDLVIHADRIEALDPRPWLPSRYVPEKALEWLDNSLHWIESAEGVVVLHMRAGKLAKQIRPGDFQAEASFSGVEIEYWPEWPMARALSGQAEFIGSGLSAQVHTGRLGEVEVSASLIEVADLTKPQMRLDIQSEQADAESIANLMQRFPVPAWEAILAPMQWSGPAAVRTRLALPFRNMDDWLIEGTVALDDTRLALPQLGLDLSGLAGQVEFDRERLGPATLTLADETGPGELALSAGFSEPAWLEIDARINPAGLLAPGSALADIGQRVRGLSQFQVRIQGAGEGEMSLNLASDLDGLALHLPPPLNKPREVTWPLAMQMQIGGGLQQGQLGLADLLAADWQLDESRWQLGLGLNEPAPELPEQPGLRARGRLPELDLADWMALIPDTPDDSLVPLAVDIEVGLGRLNVFGLDLVDLQMALLREPQAWQIELSGDSIEGAITLPVPMDSGRVLVADLRHLYLEPLPADADELDLEIHPLSAQTSTQSPRGLPPLHLLIDDLRWGAMNLGRARLESHASGEGVEVEMIDISGPDLRLNGRGRWVEREDRIHCEFQGRLTSAKLSGLLASAGYELGIEANRAQVDADLRWPGAPVDFSLARLSGSLDLLLSDGVIPEARPGAGRLLGLASFSAIPRRLMLDFRDVFGAGLRFDEIRGRFDLAAGFARTDGVVIDSPAAKITISGDTDMAARKYDQLILVEPGLGATLPVIGVLAGGPVGAAAGLVLRQLLERPLRGIAEARYSVTGPWEDPLIELIEARVTGEDGEEAVLSQPGSD